MKLEEKNGGFCLSLGCFFNWKTSFFILTVHIVLKTVFLLSKYELLI